MKAFYFFIALSAISVRSSAQHRASSALPYDGTGASQVIIEKGDQGILSDKKIQVIFIYDSMQVAHYGPEQVFIDSMTSYFETKKPGRGAEWAAEWQADKNGRFKQFFLDKFNELAGWEQSDSTRADYQLIITIQSMDPEDDTWVTHAPALIDAVCDFRDRSGKTLLLVKMEHVPGLVIGKNSLDLNLRIGHCYEKLAKDLYKAISKKQGKKRKKKAEGSGE